MATHVSRHCRIFIAGKIRRDCDIGHLRSHYSAKWNHCSITKSINITIVSVTLIHFHLWQLNSYLEEPIHQLRLSSRKVWKYNIWSLGIAKIAWTIYFFIFLFFCSFSALTASQPFYIWKCQVVWFGLSHFLIKSTLLDFPHNPLFSQDTSNQLETLTSQCTLLNK